MSIMSTSTIVRTASFVLALALAPQTGSAGSCDEEGAAELVRDLERYARGGGTSPEHDPICADEARQFPRLKARMMKACAAIIARDQAFWDCISWAADDKLQTLGGVDVYEAMAKARPPDPFDDERSYTNGYYVRYGDPRALAPMREAWAAGAADPRAKKKRFEYTWTKFRNNAITLFTDLGGAPERDFLAAQLATTTDRAIARRMKKAIAAIEKRLAGARP